MAQIDFSGIGRGFVTQYYPAYGADRSQVAGAYRDNSLMTYQGQQIMGVVKIMEFFRERVTFTTAQFNPLDIDCHPSQSNGIIVVVNGEVLLAGETRALKFNDVFHLAVDQSGQWYISNQLFRTVGSVA